MSAVKHFAVNVWLRALPNIAAQSFDAFHTQKFFSEDDKGWPQLHVVLNFEQF